MSIANLTTKTQGASPNTTVAWSKPLYTKGEFQVHHVCSLGLITILVGPDDIKRPLNAFDCGDGNFIGEGCSRYNNAIKVYIMFDVPANPSTEEQTRHLKCLQRHIKLIEKACGDNIPIDVTTNKLVGSVIWKIPLKDKNVTFYQTTGRSCKLMCEELSWLTTK